MLSIRSKIMFTLVSYITIFVIMLIHPDNRHSNLASWTVNKCVLAPRLEYRTHGQMVGEYGIYILGEYSYFKHET